MKKLVLLMVVAAVIFSSCKQEEKTDNPLLVEFDTPFGVPPFDLIKALSYLHILSFEEQKAEISNNKQSQEPVLRTPLKCFSGVSFSIKWEGYLGRLIRQTTILRLSTEIAPLASSTGTI
jgi:hypothetical protein